MDLDHVGDEVEGVRNRLSFLTQPGGYERIEDGGDAKRKRFSHAELPPDTPFDPGFLTLYFIQIYSMQLILQIIVLIWSFSSAEDSEPKVLLTLDCFAVFLLVVEVSSGLLSRGSAFMEDWGGKIDVAVAVFSVLSLAVFFAVSALNDWEHDHAAGLEFAHGMKLLRDIARLVRLPLFVRNVFAIWRWHVHHTRAKIEQR